MINLDNLSHLELTVVEDALLYYLNRDLHKIPASESTGKQILTKVRDAKLEIEREWKEKMK